MRQANDIQIGNASQKAKKGSKTHKNIDFATISQKQVKKTVKRRNSSLIFRKIAEF